MLTHMLGIHYQTGWEQNAARFPPQLSSDPAVCSVPAAHAFHSSSAAMASVYAGARCQEALSTCIHASSSSSALFLPLSPTSLRCPAPLLSMLIGRTLQACFLLSRKSKWSSEGCTWKSPSLKWKLTDEASRDDISMPVFQKLCVGKPLFSMFGAFDQGILKGGV